MILCLFISSSAGKDDAAAAAGGGSKLASLRVLDILLLVIAALRVSGRPLSFSPSRARAFLPLQEDDPVCKWCVCVVSCFISKARRNKERGAPLGGAMHTCRSNLFLQSWIDMY